MEKITILDIGESLCEAQLDSEYRQALIHALMQLEYINDDPINLHLGTMEKREKIRIVENMALDSNQISEIIHLMMYEMRNDFEYGSFKPVANKYINIAKQMENKKDNNVNKEFQKPICHIYEGDLAIMRDVLGIASKTLKQNNMFNESREMIERATLTYSYDEALDVVKEYVELVEEQEEDLEY